MADTISHAGDINVKRVEIVTNAGTVLNVTNQVVSLQIFEDLFAPFVTGQLLILDSIDISSVLPLVGEERVNIDIETPGFNGFTGQFYLYKMSNRDKYNDSASVYTLHFMSLEAAVDVNRKLSKVFQGKVSDIVEKLIRSEGFGSKKVAIIEPSNNSTKCIANFWSPARTIAYVMENAQNKSGTADYVFFENHEGYVFASLESLYGIDPLIKFVDDNYLRKMDSNGKSIRSVAEDYQRISNFYAPNLYNYLDRVQNGFYASTLTSYDLVTKKYTYTVYDAKTGKTATLNDKSLISSAFNYRPESMHMILPKYYGNFNGYTDVTNWSNQQERISLLKRAEALKIQITVPGRTDYTVGRTVMIEIYKDKPVRAGDTPADYIDKTLSGKYLISAINHSISPSTHVCNMELIKDSILGK